MTSHRRPKQPSRTRVSVLTTAAAAAVALSANAADATPGQRLGKDAVKAKVDKLYEQAGQATEKYNGANEKQQKLQLFFSSDPDDFLDKASTLDQLSGQQVEALKKIQDKQRQRAQERAEATEKFKDLAATRAELGNKKREVQGKLGEAQKLLNTLTAKEKAALDAEQQRASRSSAERVDIGHHAPASGRAGAAFSAAQSQIGKPYVHGATGPSSYDCSGLTSWAYAQADVFIPRTSEAQSGIGTRLTRSQLQVGDLVFFFNDLHHVGL